MVAPGFIHPNPDTFFSIHRQYLWFNNVKVTNENGELAYSCDQILSKIPKCINLIYECEEEIFSNETFQNMVTLEFSTKFKSFHLIFHKFSNDINFLILCDFIKKNANEKSRFFFELIMINPENYQIILQAAVDEMLQTWEMEKKPKVFFL